MAPDRIIQSRLLGFSGVDNIGAFKYEWEARRQRYDYADSLYSGDIYNTTTDTQVRKEIFRSVIGRPWKHKAEFTGQFNPVSLIVDTYQNALRGQFMREIMPSKDGRPLPDSLSQAIQSVWRMSRFDTQKEAFQYWAAAHGTVGLRIDAYTDENGGSPLVRIKPVPAGHIIDIEIGTNGAVTSVLLEYPALEGPLGEDRVTVTYRELLTKEKLTRWKTGDEKKTKTEQDNALGVCPFVLVKHKEHGAEFGLESWAGSDTAIHLINIRASQLGISVDKTLWPKWFGSGSGNAPEAFDVGGEKFIYTRRGTEDAEPKLQAIVEQLNWEGGLKQIEQLVDWLAWRQPEVLLGSLQSLSGQSGETIAKLLQPVTTRILSARDKYEGGVIDAIRQALSWGQLLGAWDLGGGRDRTSIDRMYRDGTIDFVFEKRPALSPTPFDIEAESKAENAAKREAFIAARAAEGIVPRREQILVAGYSEEDADRLAAEVEKQIKDDAARSAVGGSAARPSTTANLNV